MGTKRKREEDCSSTERVKHVHSAKTGGANARKIQDQRLQAENNVAVPVVWPAKPHGTSEASAEAAKWWIATLSAHLLRLENEHLKKACASLFGNECINSALSLGRSCAVEQARVDGLAGDFHALRSPSIDFAGSDSADPLPEAPKIMDSGLAQQVFLHRSTLTDKELRESVGQDYERLEFAGDSYLHVMSTRLIYERLPNLSPGKMSWVRERLTCNETLAQFSRQYGFDKKIKILTEKLADKNRGISKGSWQKIVADVFESYVGALVHSRPCDGFQVAEMWVRALWIPLLPQEDAIKVDKNAKVTLNTQVMGKGVKLRYEEMQPSRSAGPGRDTFFIAVKLTGWSWEDVLLGHGSGYSKQEAGQEAAKNALSNPTTNLIAAIKHRYDTLVAEERQREGGPRDEVLAELERQFK